MGLYSRYVLPKIVHFTCALKPNMRQRQKLVHRALQHLTDINREIIVLKDIQGLPLQEIADMLDLPGPPVWLQQVHGSRIITAEAGAAGTEADGSWTRVAGAVCAVMTADCLPVLFCNRDGTRVAAAHAGWRGLAAGVLENTVAALRARPSELLAWFGPAISQPNFEVGDEVREAFLAHDPNASQCFAANARGRWQADLYALAERQLPRIVWNHLREHRFFGLAIPPEHGGLGFSAQANSSIIVPLDTPSTISPPRIRAIWVEKNGYWRTKPLVPSIGSTSQSESASSRVRPVSSP